MRIRVTIEYEVDYDGDSEAILDQEQSRLTAYLGYLWVIHPPIRRSSGTSVEIKAEEIK